MRIDKLLANMGIGSRKEVKNYIKQGLVLVNNEPVKKSSQKVNIDKDEVSFRNKEIIYEEYVYIMMNKPQGYISATESYTQETVLDLLDDQYQKRGIFPAGRLDKDTEGLLLLTNDGRLAHNILSPKNQVEKTYYVELEDKILDSYKIKFIEGIYFDGEDITTMPAKLDILTDKSCYLTIKEGKYHQVKRMFEAVDNKVIYLKRVRMGSLTLDEKLNLGEYRNLSKGEVENLKKDGK